jgi:putative CocE/NonD family hydrolase
MKRSVYSAEQHEIRTSNRLRIPVCDGSVLGATVIRPDADGRFPVLVWYDPYRSGSDGRPTPMSAYFARRGYVFVYLNVRGTGNSEGYSVDEYTEPETRDGAEAIEWLADQPWSSGSVGMLGASYSGFNTLQVAALAPPSLKAIAPAYFTDRRYTDDCHYKGGCLRGYYDMLTYGLSMVGMNALPPFPEAVGASWSSIWTGRLEKSEPYLLKWLEHQIEDDYWAVGSIIAHYHKIKAAAFLIGGWHDGYLNPPLRVFRSLQSPRKLLMGPWSHTYPDQSHCGPRIDIYFELLRWWDCWLKEMDNGVPDEPPVQIFEQAHEYPVTDRVTLAGTWRMADDLPEPASGNPSDASTSFRTLYLGNGRSADTPFASSGSSSVRYLPAASRNGGLWDAGVPFTLPGEQTEDSAHAMNFTAPPLRRDLSILGNPLCDLYVRSDAEVMPVAVRLLDVDPDGVSVLVTKGVLNLTRRHGMDRPEPVEVGVITRVTFELEAVAWRFRKGHRIRISVNGSDFPNIWPTPYPGVLSLHRGPEHPSCLTLPVWDGGRAPAFEYRPSPNPPRPTGSGSAPWQIIHDVLEDRYRLRIERGGGEMGVSHRNPAEAFVRSTQRHELVLPGCHIVSEATGSMISAAGEFIMNLALNVSLNGAAYFQKQWSRTFRRELL